MNDQGRLKYLKIIESEKILNNRFTSIKRMGKDGANGCFSLMLTAKDIQEGSRVALKFFDPTKFSNSDRQKRFEREAEMLVVLKNEPMVINCIGGGLQFLTKTLIDPNSGLEFPPLELPYIVLELAEYSAEDLIYSKKNDALAILFIFKEMTKSVFRIHWKKICHRDLKPSNFLIFKDKLCLSDFGTAKNMLKPENNIKNVYVDPVGDTRYIAPEIFFSIGIADEHVFMADIFSLGAILFELFTQEVFTSQIYTKDFIASLSQVRQIMHMMPSNTKIETYNLLAEQISKKIKIPDIYSYNNAVPNSIKNHLNKLYKGLVEINHTNRLNNTTSIHRQIDICIKTLRNEESYLRWQGEKRRRRQIRLQKNHPKNKV